MIRQAHLSVVKEFTFCCLTIGVASDADNVVAAVFDEVLGDAGALVAGDCENDNGLGHLVLLLLLCWW